MKRPHIISIGEVLWDLFPDGERFGGAPANFACHAAILGAGVTMVSAVGDDERGREAIRILEEFGIDTGLVRVIPDAPTGSVGVETDLKGKPCFTIHENSAWDRIDSPPQLSAMIAGADALYFGTLGQRSRSSWEMIRRALESAKSAGVTRVLDINLRAPFFDFELIRESIEQASILKLSDDEFETVAQACGIESWDEQCSVLRVILKRFDLDSIVMTRGADGAVFVSADATVEHPGLPTEVVDTVGAGDAFTAALVIAQFRGETPTATLQNATRTASFVCSQPGAIPNPLQSST